MAHSGVLNIFERRRGSPNVAGSGVTCPALHPLSTGLPGGDGFRFFSPQPDTSLHCKTADAGSVHRAVCLFTSQLSLVVIALTHRGMAKLSEWLNNQR